ncbi:glycosyltransferase [bacterium]|nr:glycosyltransferase [bacterium]
MELKVYWFGYGGSSWMAEKLRVIIEDELGMKLITIHEHPDADIPWKLETVYKELENADIIIVPANYKRQSCKSNNRLTQAMALGKAVICDPMPAYKDIVDNLENAIILKEGTDSEWKFALSLLKDNPELREKIANNALVTAKKYSRESMAKKWLNFLNVIKKSNSSPVDVVIPTKKNIPILEECIKSFKNSTLEETIYIIDNDPEGKEIEEMVKKMDIDYEVKEI